MMRTDLPSKTLGIRLSKDAYEVLEKEAYIENLASGKEENRYRNRKQSVPNQNKESKMSVQSEIESAKKETKTKVLQRTLKAHFPYLSLSIEDEGDNNISLSFSLSDTEVLKSPLYTVESASKDLDNIVKQVKAITIAYQNLEKV